MVYLLSNPHTTWIRLVKFNFYDHSSDLFVINSLYSLYFFQISFHLKSLFVSITAWWVAKFQEKKKKIDHHKKNPMKQLCKKLQMMIRRLLFLITTLLTSGYYYLVIKSDCSQAIICKVLVSMTYEIWCMIIYNVRLYIVIDVHSYCMSEFIV